MFYTQFHKRLNQSNVLAFRSDVYRVFASSFLSLRRTREIRQIYFVCVGPERMNGWVCARPRWATSFNISYQFHLYLYRMRMNPSSFDNNNMYFMRSIVCSCVCSCRFRYEMSIVRNHIFWFDIYELWTFDWLWQGQMKNHAKQVKWKWTKEKSIGTAHTHTTHSYTHTSMFRWKMYVENGVRCTVQQRTIPSGLNGISCIGHLSNVILFIFIDWLLFPVAWLALIGWLAKRLNRVMRFEWYPNRILFIFRHAAAESMWHCIINLITYRTRHIWFLPINRSAKNLKWMIIIAILNIYE